MTAAAVESPAPARYVTADSELRFIGDEAWHRGPTTGMAWVRVTPAVFEEFVAYLRVVA